MAPGRVACAGIAAVAVFSSGVVGRSEGQSTATVMRAHDFQAQPDLALLRDVEFIRRRYEEARALLANEQSYSGDDGTALTRAVRLLGANVKHWEAIEARVRSTQLYEDALTLIAQNRATLGQAYFRSGNSENALEQLEAACPVLWEVQRTRRKPVAAQPHGQTRPSSSQQQQGPRSSTRPPSSTAPFGAQTLWSPTGGAAVAMEALDSGLTCYATLATLHKEIEARNAANPGSRSNGSIKYPWLAPGIEKDESGVSPHALKLQTLAMISKLSLLSQGDASQVNVPKRVVWSEAKAMRTQLNELVRQFSAAATAREQRALLEKAQSWVRITEADAQRVLARVRMEAKAAANADRRDRTGDRRTDSVLAGRAEEAEAAALLNELLREGGHYVSVMEGVVAKGWTFVQDDLRHVSDVMYERFQKDGYASVEIHEGFQSRLDVLKTFSYIHFGPESITGDGGSASESASSEPKPKPRKPSRQQEASSGSVVSSLLLPCLATLALALIGWLAAAAPFLRSSRAKAMQKRAMAAASKRQQQASSSTRRRAGSFSVASPSEDKDASPAMAQTVTHCCLELAAQVRHAHRCVHRRGVAWALYCASSLSRLSPAHLLAWASRQVGRRDVTRELLEEEARGASVEGAKKKGGRHTHQQQARKAKASSEATSPPSVEQEAAKVATVKEVVAAPSAKSARRKEREVSRSSRATQVDRPVPTVVEEQTQSCQTEAAIGQQEDLYDASLEDPTTVYMEEAHAPATPQVFDMPAEEEEGDEGQEVMQDMHVEKEEEKDGAEEEPSGPATPHDVSVHMAPKKVLEGHEGVCVMHVHQLEGEEEAKAYGEPKDTWHEYAAARPALRVLLPLIDAAPTNEHVEGYGRSRDGRKRASWVKPEASNDSQRSQELEAPDAAMAQQQQQSSDSEGQASPMAVEQGSPNAGSPLHQLFFPPASSHQHAGYPMPQQMPPHMHMPQQMPPQMPMAQPVAPQPQMGMSMMMPTPTVPTSMPPLTIQLPQHPYHGHMHMPTPPPHPVAAGGPPMPAHLPPHYATYRHTVLSPFPSPTGHMGPNLNAAMAFGRTPSPPMHAYGPPPPPREVIEAALRQQIEYYFSVENLCKDLYLRRQMDNEGYVLLSEIAQFNRVKHITTDIRLVVSSIQCSRLLELQMPWSVRAANGSLADCSIANLYNVKVRTTNRPERWVVRSSAQGGQMAQGNNNNNQTAQEGMVAGM